MEEPLLKYLKSICHFGGVGTSETGTHYSDSGEIDQSQQLETKDSEAPVEEPLLKYLKSICHFGGIGTSETGTHYSDSGEIDQSQQLETKDSEAPVEEPHIPVKRTQPHLELSAGQDYESDIISDCYDKWRNCDDLAESWCYKDRYTKDCKKSCGLCEGKL